MYYIDFNRLQIKKILPDELTSKVTHVWIDLGEFDSNKTLMDYRVEITNSITAVTGHLPKDAAQKPTLFNFLFQSSSTGNDENISADFESVVSVILNCFVEFNTITTACKKNREYHLDCPRDFIPYLNLSRHMSKQLTNYELKFPKFYLSIQLPYEKDCYNFELLNNQKLQSERIETLNAR